MLRPDVLILDEPTSQLDPIAAADFLGTLRKMSEDLGLTVILTEHRLEEALPMADMLAVLDEGQLIAFGEPKKTVMQVKNSAVSSLCRLLCRYLRPLTARATHRSP